MTDSSTGGFLLPTNSPPLEDAALDTVFQVFFSNLTGIFPKFVRERWAPEPQTPPDQFATWIAVGVTSLPSDQYPQQEMNADGSYTLTTNETLEVMCSFYGGFAHKAVRNACDNIMIAQNRESIEASGIFYVSRNDPIKAPVQIQTRWANRIDVTFIFRRQVVEQYNILNVLSAEGELITDTGLTRYFTVTPS